MNPRRIASLVLVFCLHWFGVILADQALRGSSKMPPNLAGLLASFLEVQELTTNSESVVAPTGKPSTLLATTLNGKSTAAEPSSIPGAASDAKAVALQKARFDQLAEATKSNADELVKILRLNAAFVVEDFIKSTQQLEQQIRNKTNELLENIYSSADELVADNEKIADAIRTVHKEDPSNI